MSLRIRMASLSDATALARVHVAAWQETYAGLLPADMLAALNIDARTALWTRILDEPRAFADALVFVAEQEGTPVGFGSCCAQRTAELATSGFDGEVSALDVLRSAQGRGVGTRLMRRMASALADRTLRGASLWVVRENRRARGFYTRLGGVVLTEREDQRSSGTLIELAYGWGDLRRLMTSSA